MSIRLYMDQHVPRAITIGLRIRNVDVLTAQEDGTSDWDDVRLLDRATALGRVLFTQDADLIAEGVRRQREGIYFAGIIYAHPLRVSIGQCIHDLEIIAKVGEPEDMVNAILFLPL